MSAQQKPTKNQQAAPQQNEETPPQAPEQAPSPADAAARWLEWKEKVAKLLEGGFLKNEAHVGVGPPQGGGAAAMLPDPVELLPLETLEKRLVALAGGPRAYWVTTHMVPNGFGPRGCFPYMQTAAPKAEPLPPLATGESTLATLVERQQARIAELESKVLSPTTPLDAMNMVRSSVELVRSIAQPAAAADPNVYLELGALRAKVEEKPLVDGGGLAAFAGAVLGNDGVRDFMRGLGAMFAGIGEERRANAARLAGAAPSTPAPATEPTEPTE